MYISESREKECNEHTIHLHDEFSVWTSLELGLGDEDLDGLLLRQRRVIDLVRRDSIGKLSPYPVSIASEERVKGTYEESSSEGSSICDSSDPIDESSSKRSIDHRIILLDNR